MIGVLLGGRAPSKLEEGGGRINLMLTVFDPEGLWPVIDNARQVGRYLLRRVWQELQTQAQDQTARQIFNRIADWHPDMVGPAGVQLFDDDAAERTPPPMLPVALARHALEALSR